MKWISAEKELPKVNYDVILYLSSGAISTGYLSSRRPQVFWAIHNEEECEASVIYWMPLPKEPKTLPTN